MQVARDALFRCTYQDKLNQHWKDQRRKQGSWLWFINLKCMSCTNLLLHIWINGPLICWISMLWLNSYVANNWMGKCGTMWVVSARETFLLMKLNCLTNTKTCLSLCKKSIKQMQFTVTWKMDKPFCNLQYHSMLQRIDKDCIVVPQRYGSLR